MADARDRAGRTLDILRILLGLIWAVNLLFIFLPVSWAYFWSSFRDTAYSYAFSTLGGPGLADFVAANPTVFGWSIVVASVYLTVALLLGFTVRLACVVGLIMSVVFFLTQWYSTFVFPGGTDVGPHPLYLAIYVALFLGGAGRYWSVDGWLWRSGRARLAKVAQWIATPA